MAANRKTEKNTAAKKPADKPENPKKGATAKKFATAKHPVATDKAAAKKPVPRKKSALKAVPKKNNLAPRPASALPPRRPIQLALVTTPVADRASKAVSASTGIKELDRSKYMDTRQHAFFQGMLQALRDETLSHMQEAKAQLAAPPELNDDLDRAQYEEDSCIALRIMDRERLLLGKIDKALQRIRKGEYGYCVESGEPIGLQRLLIRPTAEYCADIKELHEQKERAFTSR